MNDRIKKLIFYERTDIKDAFRLPLCKILYNSIAGTKSNEIAEREALSLCNDVLWAIFIEHFESHTWDQKYPIPITGELYDWQWVIAQLTDTNFDTYDDIYTEDLYDLYECICDSSTSFEFDCRDAKLIALYSNIRKKTQKTWPQLVRNYGYFEVLRIASVNEWPPLLSIEFYTLPSTLRELIINKMAKQCLTYKDACRLKELLEEYVYHFKNFEMLSEYPLLCRTIVEIQKFERIKHNELTKRVESKVLEIKRGNKVLNTEMLKDYLQKLIDTNIIPVDKRHGFVWYAVWLFFKKRELLKDKSQAGFEELMSVWFPDCGYGKSDLMRRYNSVFLETKNWEIWDYEYFIKEKEQNDNLKGNLNGNKRYSQSGFYQIKELYRILDTHLKPKNYLTKLY